MEDLLYIEPSGDMLSNPTAEQVTAFMQNGDEEYWGPYSPVGRLQFNGTPFCTLRYIRHPRRGWFIEYSSDPPMQELVAVPSLGESQEWVEHWAEGDVYFFLTTCFVAQELAEQVVADFIHTRQPSPVVAWEPLNRLVHMSEAPPDDESFIVEYADPEG